MSSISDALNCAGEPKTFEHRCSALHGMFSTQLGIPNMQVVRSTANMHDTPIFNAILTGLIGRFGELLTYASFGFHLKSIPEWT